MMCQCRSIFSNKRTILVSDVGNGTGWKRVGGGVYWKPLYLPLNLAMNLKLPPTAPNEDLFFKKDWKSGIILFLKNQELEIRARRGRGNIFFTTHYLYCLRSAFMSSPPAVSITLPISLEEAAKPAASIWKQLKAHFK